MSATPASAIFSNGKQFGRAAHGDCRYAPGRLEFIGNHVDYNGGLESWGRRLTVACRRRMAKRRIDRQLCGVCSPAL